MLNRRALLRSGFAVATLVGVGRTALAAYGSSFTFEAQMIGHNPADPMLAAFAAGKIDRLTHFNGAYNSVAGTVRINRAQYRPYLGQAQFHLWGWSGRGLELVRIRDAQGDRQAAPRAKPYRESIPSYGPPDFIFDLAGSDMAITFPPGLMISETKAQWCAPSVPGIRPTPDIGIPYTAAEIAWHMGRSPFTTTFFLVNA